MSIWQHCCSVIIIITPFVIIGDRHQSLWSHKMQISSFSRIIRKRKRPRLVRSFGLSRLQEEQAGDSRRSKANFDGQICFFFVSFSCVCECCGKVVVIEECSVCFDVTKKEIISAAEKDQPAQPNLPCCKSNKCDCRRCVCVCKNV